MAFQRKDPFAGHNFAVELDGVTSTGFKECSGLERSIGVIEYREGTDPSSYKRKLPGLVSSGNITLKRGLTSDHKLWDWQEKAATGQVERHAISIILLDDRGVEQVRWNLRNAWPVKWIGPSFDAATETVGIETLELAHEGVEVAKW
jgi:phage tail-like protein